jgi:DmsE family decaheme c-type cytochrome
MQPTHSDDSGRFRSRFSRLTLVLPAAAMLISAHAGRAQNVPGPAVDNPQAVFDKCADCHQEVVERFAASAHGRAWHFETHYSSASCETCHGDPTQHIALGDGTHIVNPRKLSAEKASELCMTCHRDNLAQAHWQGSVHQRRGVTCVTCHSMHAEAPANPLQNVAMRTELCFTCHKDIRSEMQKVSHHPVREGKMTCFDCHDPHGSLASHNLRASSTNELCYQCHTEKRGPFLWEHPPVRENCLNCHTPHGSNHPKLQTESVPFLCQQCHDSTRHPGTLYDATVLPTPGNPSTGSNRIFNRGCLNCHAAIHGSNSPSGPYLGR